MPETWTAIGIMAAFGFGALGLLATLHAKIDQLGRDLRQDMREGFTRLEDRLVRLEGRFDAHLEEHRAAGGGG
jgi:hypothetical protein